MSGSLTSNKVLPIVDLILMTLGYFAKGYVVWDQYIFPKLITNWLECLIMSYDGFFFFFVTDIMLFIYYYFLSHFGPNLTYHLD